MGLPQTAVSTNPVKLLHICIFVLRFTKSLSSPLLSSTLLSLSNLLVCAHWLMATSSSFDLRCPVSQMRWMSYLPTNATLNGKSQPISYASPKWLCQHRSSSRACRQVWCIPAIYTYICYILYIYIYSHMGPIFTAADYINENSNKAHKYRRQWLLPLDETVKMIAPLASSYRSPSCGVRILISERWLGGFRPQCVNRILFYQFAVCNVTASVVDQATLGIHHWQRVSAAVGRYIGISADGGNTWGDDSDREKVERLPSTTTFTSASEVLDKQLCQLLATRKVVFPICTQHISLSQLSRCKIKLVPHYASVPRPCRQQA